MLPRLIVVIYGEKVKIRKKVTGRGKDVTHSEPHILIYNWIRIFFLKIKR